jgi:nucleotide-binding universal stress UspA family protein
MIKTILVPTDGSDHANKAITLACDLAAKYDARVVFLHVLLQHALAADLRRIIDVTKLPGPIHDDFDRFEESQKKAAAAATATAYGIGPVMIALPDEVLGAVGNVLLEDAEAVAEKAGVKNVGLVVKQGDPAKCILSSVDDENADFIVMGTRGLSDLKGLLMGSVSHKVSHLAPCTCVTVK